MFARKVKGAMLAAAGAGALLTVMAGSASATPTITPEFTINPNALSTGAFPVSGYTNQVESDIHGTSDATVQQTTSTTQTETGWFKADKFEENGTDSSFLDTGLFNAGYIGVNIPPSTGTGTYGLYLRFTDTVSGLKGSGANQTGTVTSFEFALIADIGGNDVFDNPINPATPGSTAITNTGNDVVLAVGTLVAGSAGFQADTGGPTFNTISTFILCNGDPGHGNLGSHLDVVASNTQGACGSFDASLYFTKPVPFFSVDLNSATSGSSTDVHTTDTGGTTLPGGIFAITGVGADINFIGQAPEPISISLFGAGLAGAAAYGRRRKAKKA